MMEFGLTAPKCSTVVVMGCAIVASMSVGAVEAGLADTLRFSIGTEKPEYVLYEPVLLNLRLTNEADIEVSVPGSLSVASGDVVVSITDPTGTRHRYHGGTYADIYGARIRLEARGFEESTEFVIWNGSMIELAFPAAGTYVIEGEFHSHEDGEAFRLEAAGVEVTVVNPRPADLEFIDRVGSSDYLVTLLVSSPSKYCGRRSPVECFEDLRSIVRETPASAYAPFVLLYLAMNVESDALEVTPKLAVIEELYGEISDRWPGKQLQGIAYLKLGEMAVKGGNDALAEEYFTRVRAEFPAMKGRLLRLRARLAAGE